MIVNIFNLFLLYLYASFPSLVESVEVTSAVNGTSSPTGPESWPAAAGASNHSSGTEGFFPDTTATSSVEEASTVSGIDDASGTGTAAVGRMIQKVFLWTPGYHSGQQYELLSLDNDSSIVASHYSSSLPTVILVHGFLGNGLEPWILAIKDKLLELSSSNVLSVQWPSGSAYFVIDYYHVVSHVPVVGKEIAVLLGLIGEKKGVSYNQVHIIGHSLGAHIAGFVGKNVASPIARISGLDPAGLTYHGTDASQRLDKGDASYVDVIHTNGCRNYFVWTDCFGIDTPLGHTDYWPNGGRHQPACRSSVQGSSSSQPPRNGTASGLSWSVGCDHMMSHTYYLESLDYARDTSSGLFLARPCDAYTEYKAGNCSCGHIPQFMGYSSDYRATGDYYLNTSKSSPYALPDPGCPTSFPSTLSVACQLAALLLVMLLLAGAVTLSVYWTSVRCCSGCCCCGYSGSALVNEVEDNEADGDGSTTAGSCNDMSAPGASCSQESFTDKIKRKALEAAESSRDVSGEVGSFQDDGSGDTRVLIS